METINEAQIENSPTSEKTAKVKQVNQVIEEEDKIPQDSFQDELSYSELDKL